MAVKITITIKNSPFAEGALLRPDGLDRLLTTSEVLRVVELSKSKAVDDAVVYTEVVRED